MGMTLAAKIAAFCRELGDESDDASAPWPASRHMESVFTDAEESVKAGQIGPELEADLDSLDEMVRGVEGQGLYPAATRGYAPLPGRPGRAVAQARSGGPARGIAAQAAEG